MTIHINNELMLRLLDIQEFFANQWMGAFSNDYKKISEQLKNIKKQQLSLRELSKEDKDGEGSSGGGGRGTIKGLRAKDDPNKRNPFSTRMGRK